MLQCANCEFCEKRDDGDLVFTCDPFINVKEPECLVKWQLLKLNAMLYHQEQIQLMHERFAPMQEKLFDYMEREIQEQDEAESWKESPQDYEDEEEEDQ